MSIDNQLAGLLVLNGQVRPKADAIVDGNAMLLAGTADDPDSFNAEGGRTVDLGHYPLVSASGETLYAPSLCDSRRTCARRSSGNSRPVRRPARQLAAKPQ